MKHSRHDLKNWRKKFLSSMNVLRMKFKMSLVLLHHIGSYLDMVQTLLDYQRSLRTGDWDLHLRATEKMLPWFHAYDHFNYTKHFSYYWCTQQNLGDTHPGLRQAYLNQHFSAKRTVGRFNRLPVDQVIEKTINKEQKGKGGIIGSSISEQRAQ